MPLLLQHLLAWERTSACTCCPVEQVFPVSLLHPGTGFVLPTRSYSAWLKVVWFAEWWSCPRSCCFPTGRLKSHDSSELTTGHLCGLKGNVFEARAPTQRPQPDPSHKWKQLRPRRPVALEMCGEFCTDTPTPRRHVSDKTRLPSGAQPLWPRSSPEAESLKLSSKRR